MNIIENQVKEWWNKVFKEDGKTIMGLALSLSGDKQDANDLVQEAALRVMLYGKNPMSPEIKSVGHLRAMICQAIRWLHMNWWHRAQLRLRMEEDLYGMINTTEDFQFRDEYFPYFKTIMKRYNSRLTSIEKAVIKGVFLEGLTGLEIERKYGIDARGVGVMKALAIDKLRKNITHAEMREMKKQRIIKLHDEGYAWYQVALMMGEGKDAKHYCEYYSRSCKPNGVRRYQPKKQKDCY